MPAKEIIEEIRSLQKIKRKLNPTDSAISVIDDMIKKAKERLNEWDVFSYHNKLCFWCGENIDNDNGICYKCKY